MKILGSSKLKASSEAKAWQIYLVVVFAVEPY